jgi:hypothetical protein
MNKRETLYLFVALLLVGAFVYILEFSNSNASTSPSSQTPTLGPLWNIAPGTLASVKFEEIKTGYQFELKNDAGKWVMSSYALVTPTMTPTNTATLAPTLGENTPTATFTASPTATITNTPSATLAVSLTPTTLPTFEADSQSWPFMLEQLRGLTPVLNIGEKTPKDFGLDLPRYKLTLTATDGKSAVLLIGANAPVKSAGYYAQIQGGKAIFLVSADLVDVLISYFWQPPVIMTPTPTLAETATLATTATSLPSSTPTVAPTDTPAPTATAS